MAAPLQNIFGYGGVQVDPGTLLTGVDPKMQELIDQGIISQTSRDYMNEGGEGNLTMNNVDWSRLPAMGPSSAAGFGLHWVTAANPDQLVDRSKIYNDPNYGPLTYSQNLKADHGDWQDYIGPAIMALVTMGAGALPAFGAGAATSAAAAGVGALAGDAFMPGALSGFYGAASTPWYVSAGLDAAKAIGGAGGSSTGGSSAAQQKAAPTLVPTYPGTTLPMTFNPTNFGNSSGTPPVVPTGSAPVATNLVPDAYGASNASVGYNQVYT